MKTEVMMLKIQLWNNLHFKICENKYVSNPVFNNKCTFAKMLLKVIYRASKTEELWGN